jgi:hypothetical protein
MGTLMHIMHCIISVKKVLHVRTTMVHKAICRYGIHDVYSVHVNKIKA